MGSISTILVLQYVDLTITSLDSDKKKNHVFTWKDVTFGPRVILF